MSARHAAANPGLRRPTRRCSNSDAAGLPNDRRAAAIPSLSYGVSMNKLFPVIALVVAVFAGQAQASCETQAAEKNLSGAAKTSFVKKCEQDAAAGGASASCEAQATEKKLAGAAKTSFLKKCVADAGGASASSASAACEAQAAEKKLAGAAKTSFVKKCVADAAK
jgi:hypothetical protein